MNVLQIFFDNFHFRQLVYNFQSMVWTFCTKVGRCVVLSISCFCVMCVTVPWSRDVGALPHRHHFSVSTPLYQNFWENQTNRKASIKMQAGCPYHLGSLQITIRVNTCGGKSLVLLWMELYQPLACFACLSFLKRPRYTSICFEMEIRCNGFYLIGKIESNMIEMDRFERLDKCRLCSGGLL